MAVRSFAYLPALRHELTCKQVIDQTHFDDPNLDKDHLAFDDESPYPEVRSAVSNTDDPTMPVSTVRSWVIGVIWAILIPGLNQFFFFRYPSVTITGIVAQLLSFPIGRAAAAWVPNWSVFGFQLNPGPFTVKEHVLVTVSYLVSVYMHFQLLTIVLDNGEWKGSITLYKSSHISRLPSAGNLPMLRIS